HGLSPRVAEMRRVLRDGHPALADFPLETSWNGPIDRTVSGVPLFGALPANRDVVYGYGFSGTGTTMAYIGGEILTGLLTDGESELTHSALVRPVARGFPPEPFRFVGAHFVRGAVRRRDDLEHAGRKLNPVTRWLAGLAPSGVTPSKANLRAKKG
ncbi:FAD-dependent oxidoreductase, partial [Mesorhizobium sp. M7A.F.Ca.CA.001.07.2.1]|uniref:FAD-dependent oxidoreductase n=1 Tax=Mesorhizobium sp. M7A.F.Ca.CA.001.07.2.1 TaxID=2496684 RepID=UPI0032AF8930